MIRNKVVLALTFVGSAVRWWPAIVEPSVDFSRWILLGLVALIAAVATASLGGRWLRVVAACTVGTFVGTLSGSLIWPPHDGIAGSYSGIAAIVAAVAAGIVSFAAGLPVALVLRRLTLANRVFQGALWVMLAGCVAVGPVGLALTPVLVARRVARNDAIAEKRFTALKGAVEETWAEPDGARRVCVEQGLKAHYFGPPFSDDDWRRIAGNYVEQDGYVYMIYCDERGYTIDVRTKRPTVYGYGSRIFCTDQSKRIGCGSEQFWNKCEPCGL